MPALFDPEFDELPERLRMRIEAWNKSPSRWQDELYGPLGAYLALLFPPSYFLIKPQALLRAEASPVAFDPCTAPDADSGDDSDGESDTSDGSHNEGEDREVSIDSQGLPVTKERHYPDFAICQYWGANEDSEPDIVRVVVEVGKHGAKPSWVRGQLLSSMERLGNRWKGKVLGVGLVGNMVFLATNKDSIPGFHAIYGDVDDHSDRSSWISFNDKRFIEQLRIIRDYSLEHDCDGHDE